MPKHSLTSLTLSAAIAALPLFAPLAARAQLAGDAAPAAVAKPADANVPVKVVVLFSSGVGYFEHSGPVKGNASTELRFKTNQINDILKSLVLQDMAGGKVTVDGSEEIVRIVSKATGIEPKLYQSLVANYVHPDGNVHVESLRQDYEFFKKQGWMEGKASVDELVDTSFAEAAVKGSLGLRTRWVSPSWADRRATPASPRSLTPVLAMCGSSSR